MSSRNAVRKDRMSDDDLTLLAHKRADDFLYRISDLDQGIDDIFYRILGPSVERFSAGRDLDGDGFARLGAETRAVMAELEPVRFFEERDGLGKDATRREFVSIHRIPMVGDRHGHSLAGLRITMTRERVLVEKDYLGLDIQRHAMFRSMQRRMLNRDARFAEYDEFTSEALGLAVIWRHARALGYVDIPNVAMPFRNGVLLGNMLDIRDRDLGSAREIDASGVKATALAPNFFNSADLRVEGNPVTCAPVILNTALGGETMGRQRHDMRSKLVSFSRRYANLIHDLAIGSAWRRQEMVAHPNYVELLPEIMGAAENLGDIVSNPRYRDSFRRLEERTPVAVAPEADAEPAPSFSR